MYRAVAAGLSFLVAVFATSVAGLAAGGGVFPHAPHDAAQGVGCMACHQYPLTGG